MKISVFRSGKDVYVQCECVTGYAFTVRGQGTSLPFLSRGTFTAFHTGPNYRLS